jgi:superfamily I DNA and/or RNA helicase
VQLIRESLRLLDLDIEVNTVDQYQGREKSVIIVSFTKSQRNPDTTTINEVSSI